MIPDKLIIRFFFLVIETIYLGYSRNLKLKAKQAERDATSKNIFHLNVSTQQIFTSYKNLVSYRRWKVFLSIKDLLGCKNEIIDLCQSNKQNKSPFKTFP